MQSHSNRSSFFFFLFSMFSMFLPLSFAWAEIKDVAKESPTSKPEAKVKATTQEKALVTSKAKAEINAKVNTKPTIVRSPEVRLQPLDKSMSKAKTRLAVPAPQKEESPAVWKGWGIRLNDPKRNWSIGGTVEVGTLAILSHTLQFSKNGTVFDLVGEGGQDTLFFYQRLQLDFSLFKRHKFVFLYQPFNLVTKTILRREISQDNIVFAKGSSLDLRYGFDFYRISYMYDFFPKNHIEVALGFSLQIRNAVLEFNSGDGSKRAKRQNIGPVPVLKLRTKYTFSNGLFLGFEIDGFYAPIRFLNGGSTDVEGAIVDTSIKLGLVVTPSSEVFLNIRYIGGGAQGTSSSYKGTGDGFNLNWLHALAISIGFSLV